MSGLELTVHNPPPVKSKVLHVKTDGRAVFYRMGQQPNSWQRSREPFSICTPRKLMARPPIYQQARMVSSEVQTSPFLMQTYANSISAPGSVTHHSNAAQPKPKEPYVRSVQTNTSSQEPIVSFNRSSQQDNRRKSEVPVATSSSQESSMLNFDKQKYASNQKVDEINSVPNVSLKTPVSIENTQSTVVYPKSHEKNTSSFHGNIAQKEGPLLENVSENSTLPSGDSNTGNCSRGSKHAESAFDGLSSDCLFEKSCVVNIGGPNMDFSPPKWSTNQQMSYINLAVSPSSSVFENAQCPPTEPNNTVTDFEETHIDEENPLKLTLSTGSYSLVEKSESDYAKQYGEEFSIDVRNSMSMMSTNNCSPSFVEKSNVNQRTPSKGATTNINEERTPMKMLSVTNDYSLSFAEKSNLHQRSPAVEDGTDDVQNVMNMTRTMSEDLKHDELSGFHNSYKIVLNETYCCSERVYEDEDKETEVESLRCAKSLTENNGILEVSMPSEDISNLSSYSKANSCVESVVPAVDVSNAEPLFTSVLTCSYYQLNELNVTQEEIQLTGLLGDYARRLRGLRGVRKIKVLKGIECELAQVTESEFEEAMKEANVIFPDEFVRSVILKRKCVQMRKTPYDVLLKTIDNF